MPGLYVQAACQHTMIDKQPSTDAAFLHQHCIRHCKTRSRGLQSNSCKGFESTVLVAVASNPSRPMNWDFHSVGRQQWCCQYMCCGDSSPGCTMLRKGCYSSLQLASSSCRIVARYSGSDVRYVDRVRTGRIPYRVPVPDLWTRQQLPGQLRLPRHADKVI